MDIETIITAVVSALGGGGIGSFIGWRAKKRQDNADAAKTEAEAKGDQIENIEKMVEKAYKPTIETLENRVKELSWEVEQLRAGNAKILARNEELEAQNATYRRIILELRPDLIPERIDRRGENGKTAPRDGKGHFVKREDA